MAIRRIGQIFVDLGFVSDEQLEMLLEEQQQRPGTLLGKIAQVFADEEKVAELEVARTVEDVQGILGQVGTPASHT